MRTHPTLHQRSHAKGFILLFVLILLIGLMVTSAGFFYRATDSTKISGTERDYDQALMLAEAGSNLVAGRFFNLDTTQYTLTGCTGTTAVGDMDCDGELDNSQGRVSSTASAIPNSPLNPLPYQFYMSTTVSGGITQSSPSLLQRVADGEARNSGSSQNSREILTSVQYLRIRDLFSNTDAPGNPAAKIRPLLFVQDANGLTRSTNKWQDESASEKVAVWLEVTKNPDPNNSQWSDIYLCSAAQVGNAKAYLLRFMGSYSNVFGTLPAPLSESANHG